jgi:hypothetical protein
MTTNTSTHARSTPQSRRDPEQAPAPKTLNEQKRDFTAEGAPPPGRVDGDHVPAMPDVATRSTATDQKPDL